MAYNKRSKTRIKKTTAKYKTRDRRKNERNITTNNSSVSSTSCRSNTSKKMKSAPVSRTKKIKTVTYKMENKKPTPQRAVSDAGNRVARKKHSALRVIENEDSNLKELFHEVISDLMARKDRRTTLQYVRLTSTPDWEEDEMNSDMSTCPSLGPFPAENLKSHQTSMQSWNQNSSLSNSVSSSKNPRKTTSKSSKPMRHSSTSDKSKPTGIDSFYYNGPEYVRWATKNDKTKCLKRATIPEDLRQPPIPIRGAFRSQLMHYRSDANKKQDGSQLQDFKKVVEEVYARSGNYDLGWNSSEESDANVSQKTSVRTVQVTSVLPSSKPIVRKRSDSFISESPNLVGMPEYITRAESFKGQRFGVSQAMKSLGLQIPPMDKETKLNSSTLLSSFAPQSHSTPKAISEDINYVIKRQASSDSALIPISKKSRRPARTSQSLVNSCSSSIFTTPPAKRQPWLVEAAKKLEGAQVKKKSAMLSPSYLAKCRSSVLTPTINITDRSVSPSATFVTAMDSKASLSDTENVTNAEENGRIFHHKKNIHLRMMIDQDKPLEADCSIKFDSTKANPVIKITELQVDDRSFWKHIPNTPSSSVSEHGNKRSMRDNVSPRETKEAP